MYQVRCACGAAFMFDAPEVLGANANTPEVDVVEIRREARRDLADILSRRTHELELLATWLEDRKAELPPDLCAIVSAHSTLTGVTMHKYKPRPGEDIRETARRMLALAAAMGEAVSVDHHGILLTAPAASGEDLMMEAGDYAILQQNREEDIVAAYDARVRKTLGGAS